MSGARGHLYTAPGLGMFEPVPDVQLARGAPGGVNGVK